MSVIEVPVQIRLTDLLRAIERLSPTEFGVVASRVADIQRNQHEEQVGALIEEFKAKMDEFFTYVRSSPEGQRLIVKMQSRLPEEEIYADFGKIYRKYKAFYRKKVGDYFFTVTEELVEKLCDEFEAGVVGGESQ